MGEKEPWVPTSKEEWEDMLATGFRKAAAAEREEEAKAGQKPPEPDPKDQNPKPKRGLRDILLGNPGS